MQVDYLIVGQGICGTLLSRQLLQAGKTVFVVDDANPSASSRTAGGIINPVTGKRLVKSWLIDTLLPSALQEYKAMEDEFKETFITPAPILDFHSDAAAADLFRARAIVEQQYLHTNVNEDEWHPYFQFNHGIGNIAPSYLVALKAVLYSWKGYLSTLNSFINTRFDLHDLLVTTDGIQYQDIGASCVIFCDGATCSENQYFDKLPWSKDKGEALVVSIPDLPRTYIYKYGISIVPYGDENIFWVGASHDWNYTTTEPTEVFRRRVTGQLDSFLKLPYNIVDQTASLRPANFDRRPFVGMHPIHKQIGIFNGMGGKGCSLAPYFARQFADHLVNKVPLMPEVSLDRYARILSR